MQTNILRVPRKRERRFSKNPKIRSTATAGVGRRTQKGINGISSTKSKPATPTNVINSIPIGLCLRRALKPLRLSPHVDA